MVTTAEVLDRLRAIDTTSLVDAGGDLRILPAELRHRGRGGQLSFRELAADPEADRL